MILICIYTVVYNHDDNNSLWTMMYSSSRMGQPWTVSQRGSSMKFGVSYFQTRLCGFPPCFPYVVFGYIICVDFGSSHVAGECQ